VPFSINSARRECLSAHKQTHTRAQRGNERANKQTNGHQRNGQTDRQANKQANQATWAGRAAGGIGRGRRPHATPAHDGRDPGHICTRTGLAPTRICAGTRLRLLRTTGSQPRLHGTSWPHRHRDSTSAPGTAALLQPRRGRRTEVRRSARRRSAAEAELAAATRRTAAPVATAPDSPRPPQDSGPLGSGPTGPSSHRRKRRGVAARRAATPDRKPPQVGNKAVRRERPLRMDHHRTGPLCISVKVFGTASLPIEHTQYSTAFLQACAKGALIGSRVRADRGFHHAPMGCDAHTAAQSPRSPPRMQERSFRFRSGHNGVHAAAAGTKRRPGAQL
jgi:hypothetical protein